MRNFLLLIHLLSVVAWIGGMAFAHFCLRPVAAEQLPPPQRLPLLAAVLGRFFKIVSAAIVLLWVTGLSRLIGLESPAPWNWHAMAGIAAVMTLIFVIIVSRYYARLRSAVASQNWPMGGAAMNTIRQLVFTNLILGTLTIVVAILLP
jgi:uncharacterized membrane protein